MSVLSYVAVDWHRYNISECQWPYPFPAQLVRYHHWQLQCDTPLAWTWDLGKVNIVVPAGYTFDGASIPVWSGGFVDPIAALIGSLPHDVLYETQAGWRPYRVKRPDGSSFDAALVDSVTGKLVAFDGANPPDGERRRARADAVLRAFWVASGMPGDMADRGYAAVRIAGRGAWEDD